MDFLTTNVLISDRVNTGLNGARALLRSSMFQDMTCHWIMKVRLHILFIFQSVKWTDTDNMNSPTMTFIITTVSYLQKFTWEKQYNESNHSIADHCRRWYVCLLKALFCHNVGCWDIGEAPCFQLPIKIVKFTPNWEVNCQVM